MLVKKLLWLQGTMITFLGTYSTVYAVVPEWRL